MRNNWTIIIADINGKCLRTDHYESKSDAVASLRHYTGLGYQVTMMKYGVWIHNKNK